MNDQWTIAGDLTGAGMQVLLARTGPIPAAEWDAFVEEFCDVSSRYEKKLHEIEFLSQRSLGDPDFQLMCDNPSGRYLSMAIINPLVVCGSWISESMTFLNQQEHEWMIDAVLDIEGPYSLILTGYIFIWRDSIRFDLERSEPKGLQLVRSRLGKMFPGLPDLKKQRVFAFRKSTGNATGTDAF